MSAEIRAVPPHVPPGLVVDFDFVHPEGAETDPYATLKRLPWLRRTPDFWIKPGASVRTATGIVHGVLSLPLAWNVR